MSARPGLCGGHRVTGVPTAIKRPDYGCKRLPLKLHQGAGSRAREGLDADVGGGQSPFAQVFPAGYLL